MEKSTTPPRFMIIDDDPINNHICSKYIHIMFPGAAIQSFTDPQKALDHINSSYPLPGIESIILFLDINMPVLSGWDVLERFAGFTDAIKKQFKVFILSSSVALEDKQKAADSPYIAGFLEKPLTIPRLQNIFANSH